MLLYLYFIYLSLIYSRILLNMKSLNYALSLVFLMPCLNSLNEGDFLWMSGGINLLHNIMMLLKNVELFNQLML